MSESNDQAGDAGSSPISNREIHRRGKEWIKQKHKDHLDYIKRFSFHTSGTFMDYLHGDVNQEHAEIACYYEYARESKVLRDLAAERDALLAIPENKKLSCEAVVLHILQQIPNKWELGVALTENFLICESFPEKDWNALSTVERDQIMRFYRTKKIPPLAMRDIWSLKAFGVLKQFQDLAEQATPVIKDVPPGAKPEPMKLVRPVLQERDGPNHYAIFTLDFSKGETGLCNEFKEWLRLPENKELLKKYKKPMTGITGKPLDRLKDLVAWRLYREHKNDWGAANDFADKRRKQRKPFRDAKPSAERPANEAPLFGEDADARKAQLSAWQHLAEIMPGEFAPPGPHMLAALAEIDRLGSKE
jgi:hypothetical protein